MLNIFIDFVQHFSVAAVLLLGRLPHKRYSRLRNFEEGPLGYFFQGRFGSCVLDERHLVAATRYVEGNPVRAGIVKEPWAYPWSSAGYHTGERAEDLLVDE
jgi:putative transposase